MVSNYCDFDKIRKIKNNNNRKYFQSYLIDIFNDLSEPSGNNTNNMSKLTFLEYLNLPFFISEKLFNVISPGIDKLNKNTFVDGLNTIYNSASLSDSVEIIFKLLDFDDDGLIIPDDVRMILNFIKNKSNKKLDVEYLIENFFFAKNTIDYDEFVYKTESSNSDIYFIVLYFILDNSPFNENSLNIYKLDKENADLKNHKLDIVKVAVRKKQSFARNIYSPAKKLFEFLSIEKNQFLKDDSDEMELDDLNKVSCDIIIPQLNHKTLISLEKSKNVPIKQTKNLLMKNYTISNVSEISKIANNLINVIKYENYVYKFIDKNGKLIRKKRWLVLYNKDLFYFKDNKKEKLKKLQNLSGFYIKNEITDYIFNNHTYYSFYIKRRTSTNYFYCKSEFEIQTWIEEMKNVLNQRDFNDTYIIGNKIGQGGFGKVYLSETKTGEKVAIKILEKSKSDAEIEKFKTEIQILKFCIHENIVRYIDDSEDENNYYLVQEYMDSGDLSKIIKNNIQDFNEVFVKKIIKQIAKGLKYLHSYGIIHRDLKPQNILVKNYPSFNIIIKIGDFGLSKMIGKNEMTCECLGTLYYTSPEILKKLRYDNRVDIWSLGVILYYLIFRKLPFDDIKKDQNSIFKKICTRDYEIPINKVVSKALIEMFKICLEKNFERRANIYTVLDHQWFY